jgi:hypothetical protein
VKLSLGVDLAFPFSEQLLQTLDDILPLCEPVPALPWVSLHVVQEGSRYRAIDDRAHGRPFSEPKYAIRPQT